MLDLGFSMQTEPHGWHTCKGTDISMRSWTGATHPALCLQQALARRTHRFEKQAGSPLPGEVGTKTEGPAKKMWELFARFGCHGSSGRAVVALENLQWGYVLMWLRTKDVANKSVDLHRFTTS